MSGSPPVRVHEINPSEKKVLLKISEKALGEKLENSMPARLSLLPHELVPAAPIPQAIEQVASEWLKDESLPRPLRDFLLRSCSNISGVPKGQTTHHRQRQRSLCPVRGPQYGEHNLCIQAPRCGKNLSFIPSDPGSSESGKKIGISSNSHKAIPQPCGRLL